MRVHAVINIACETVINMALNQIYPAGYLDLEIN